MPYKMIYYLPPKIGGGGVQPHFCPTPNPDFDVSCVKNVQKWGKKYMKEREKVFVLANC